MVRVPSDDHLLEVADERIIGYATWGAHEGSPGFVGATEHRGHVWSATRPSTTRSGIAVKIFFRSLVL